MILGKDDILQKGDLIHYKNSVIKADPLPENPTSVKDMGAFNDFLYVERPDPTPDLAAQVKILREALENIENIHFGAYKDANTGEEAAYMRKLARAALAATKG
jgi:hypothetical protein